MGGEIFFTKKLGPLCSKIGSGATPRGGSKVYLEDGKISLIRSQNVRNEHFDPNGLVFIENIHATQLSNVVVEEHDVLLNITGDSVARCCQVDPNKLPARVNQHVAIIRPDAEQLDPRFLRYFLISPDMQNHMLGLAGAGATRNALTKEMIKGFDIPVPDITEQRAIAHILGSLDDKIELNRKMNETLEAMAQALFKSWFVDFDPVIDNALAAGNEIPEELKERAAKRQAVRARHAVPQREDFHHLFPAEFEYTEEMGPASAGKWVPKGWEVSTVGDEVEIVGGGTPSTKDESYWTLGIHAFCTPKDMSTLPTKVLLNTERLLTDKGVEKVSSGQLPSGTILISSRAPIGYLAIADVPVTVNQGIIALVKQERFGELFLFCWASCNMDKIMARANGSTFLEISKKNFRPIPFLLPEDGIRKAFSRGTDAITKRLIFCTRNMKELSVIRDTLLPKLLSGEIRIEDVEKVL